MMTRESRTTRTDSIGRVSEVDLEGTPESLSDTFGKGRGVGGGGGRVRGELV